MPSITEGNKGVTKTLKLPRLDYFKAHLRISGAIAPNVLSLADRQIDVLSAAMYLGDFDRPGIRKLLGISSSNLSNITKELKRKKLLGYRDGHLVVNPGLFPAPNGQTYLIEIQSGEDH